MEVYVVSGRRDAILPWFVREVIRVLFHPLHGWILTGLRTPGAIVDVRLCGHFSCLDYDGLVWWIEYRYSCFYIFAALLAIGSQRES